MIQLLERVKELEKEVVTLTAAVEQARAVEDVQRAEELTLKLRRAEVHLVEAQTAAEAARAE